MTPVRKLTQQGRTEFRAWLDAGAGGDAPAHLLYDSTTSEEIEGGSQVELRTFVSRLELGQYLVAQLAPIKPSIVGFDEGLWDWLSLFFIDELLPRGDGGVRDRKERVRYSLELRNRKWSRHVLRVSWMAVKEHGVAARVMLAVPLWKSILM